MERATAFSAPTPPRHDEENRHFPQGCRRVTIVWVRWVMSARSRRAGREGLDVLYTYVAMAVIISSKMYAMGYAIKTYALQMVTTQDGIK